MTLRNVFDCPKFFLPIALERSKQRKLKTLDAGTCFDDIAGVVNSDKIDDFAFTGYRLAIIVFDNLTPLRGCGGESGVSKRGVR